MKHNQYIAFKADDELKQKLQEYAQETHRSMSGTIKHALSKLWLSEPIKTPQEENNDTRPNIQ